ncbi:putative fertility inhibition protein [Shigella dysenteriae 1617]|nr:putative fertility inhibition protein [Shigella dysenteriae 1617]
MKKQKLAEKAAREAELAAKKAQARQALSIYLNLPTLDEAVNILKPWWPGLFDGDTPRLLACGIRDVLLEDVAQRDIPLSHKKTAQGAEGHHPFRKLSVCHESRCLPV